MLLHELVEFYRIAALLSAAVSRESFLSNTTLLLFLTYEVREKETIKEREALVRRALARWQDLIASADTGARAIARISFLRILAQLSTRFRRDGDGLECHRRIRQHTSAYLK